MSLLRSFWSATSGLSLFALAAVLLSPVVVYSQSNPVPQIDMMSPSAIAPGGAPFTLTIQGANFTPGSVVNWNGVPHATSFVSAGELTAAIDALDISVESTAVITVSNPPPAGASNAQFFSVVSPASRVAFRSAVIANLFTTSNVVEGDFNNDGKLDLAVAVDNAIYVLPGNGDGTFQPPIGSFGPPSCVFQGLHVADVNNDGKLDLYATGYNNSVSVIATLFGGGDGTFQAPVETALWGTQISSPDFVFADFNGDGILDAAFVADPNQIIVLNGNSDGSFSPGPISTVSPFTAVRALAAADFTGQGNLSLLVQLGDPSTADTNFIGVFTGSNGSFNSSASAYLTVGGPFHTGEKVVVADFNRDGFLDIATVTSGIAPGSSSYVAVWLNVGNVDTPVFGTPYTVPGSTSISQSRLHSLLVGDFNGDGNPDLASDGLIFFSNGDGTFPTSTAAAQQQLLLAADFNNDGKPDLITTDTGSGQIPGLGILQQIPPSSDFSLSLSESVLTGALNQTAYLSVSVQALSGFSSDVALSVSGLPAGIAPLLLPASVPGGSGTANLALTVGSDIAPGMYTITVTAAGGGITHNSVFTFAINSSVGDFSETVAPDRQNVFVGQSAQFVVAISPLYGFTGDVTLTLAGSLPPGSTYSFSSPVITGGIGMSTLTITAPGALAPASSFVSFVTISAASGTISKSKTIALGIDPLPLPPIPPVTLPPTLPPPSNHTIHLTWQVSSSQIVGYRVYRSIISVGGCSPLTALNTQPINALTYDDSTVSSGTAYYYVVTAVNASGEESPYSNVAATTVPSP